MSQTSGGIAGNLFSGNTVQCVASRLSAFTHIVFRAVTGVSRFLSINFHYFPHPVCSSNFTVTGNVLSDGRIKTDRQEVSGTQYLDILSNIKTMTYTRTDSGEKRLGHIADDVETAIAELGISNVTGSTNTAPGDLPYGEFKTLDYSRLVPLLISDVNTLNARVTELEAKLPKSKKQQSKIFYQKKVCL